MKRSKLIDIVVNKCGGLEKSATIYHKNTGKMAVGHAYDGDSFDPKIPFELYKKAGYDPDDLIIYRKYLEDTGYDKDAYNVP